jgi:hypothetical protein
MFVGLVVSVPVTPRRARPSLDGYPWLEREDIQACLAYARRLVGHERVEPFIVEAGQ